MILRIVISNFDEKKVAKLLLSSVTLQLENSEKSEPKTIIAAAMDTLQAC